MPPRKGTQLHPNSLANLNRQGGQPRYEEPKKQRNIQVTSVGWDGIRALASERGLSLNELIEQIGRGKIPLGDADEAD
ncbi:MAG TPA: hypothetical protein DDW76_34010 [Cyanobacteria bacterium UBA11369]|nr:hypothetical protein [Cyanobacteria bacterium UBA11371]HBE31279.1 hypothetical protein [Cyanobacteria bacterium UBA11368]HBE53632.1 hypothetical protein [Cyanobacteria bacterium UBA11369]